VAFGDGSVKPQDIRNNFASQGLVPQVFNMLDLDHDGTVTLSEIQASSHPGGVNLPAVQGVFLPAVQDVIRLCSQKWHLERVGNKWAVCLGLSCPTCPAGSALMTIRAMRTGTETMLPKFARFSRSRRLQGRRGRKNNLTVISRLGWREKSIGQR